MGFTLDRVGAGLFMGWLACILLIVRSAIG
jgi:hypothetical protein